MLTDADCVQGATKISCMQAARRNKLDEPRLTQELVGNRWPRKRACSKAAMGMQALQQEADKCCNSTGKATCQQCHEQVHRDVCRLQRFGFGSLAVGSRVST